MPDMSNRRYVLLDQTTSPSSQSRTIIRPPAGWQLINFGELWNFRELCGFLVWRDVKVRYKQTVLGAVWAILQPVLLMVVFTIFLPAAGRRELRRLTVSLVCLCRTIAMDFFFTAITNAGNSVVGSERLITKIYFPAGCRFLLHPLVPSLVVLIAFGMLIWLMIWYRVVPSPAILLIPLIIALLAMAALGVGTLLAALNVAYRDFRYVIPFP